MKKSNFTEVFYKNAGYFTVVLISLVYVAGSLITISKTGKSIYEIIGTGVLSLIVGTMINGIFRSMGIRRGDEDERTIATIQLHAKSVDEITPYIDRLDTFCDMENKRVMREIRTRILAREGLKYSDYFDSEGNATSSKNTCENGESDSLNKHKLKAYTKALKVKIKPLTASLLTADGVNTKDPFDFGKSKKEFTTQKNASDVAIKLLMALIFGYFGVSLTNDVNLASLIWNSLQIVLYVASGVIQMYNSYMWVVDDYRGSVIKKIDYLQKFKNYCQSYIDLGKQPI